MNERMILDMKDAIRNGDTARVAQLLDAGFPLQEPAIAFAFDINTPLAFAARQPYPETVKLLVERSADINGRHGEKFGMPLDRAVEMAHPNKPTYPQYLAIIKFLLKQGADTEISTRVEGETILFHAVRNGKTEIVQLLLDHGANINAINNHGDTPLTSLFSTYHEETEADADMIRLLLKNGANINHFKGKVLTRAAREDTLDFMEELIDQGAKPSLALANIIRMNRNLPIPGHHKIAKALATEIRDQLIEDANDEAKYPKGTHPLDHHPALAKKLAAAVGTEDFRYVTEVIHKACTMLAALDLPADSEAFYDLITPKEKENFKQMALQLRHYDYEKYEDIRDMVAEIRDSLFIPKAAIESGFDSETFDEMCQYKHYLAQTHDLKEKLGTLAANTLIKGNNSEDMLGLSETWHSPRHAIPAELRPLAAAGAWHALAEDVALPSGYKIVCRRSAKELKDESRQLSHCVGKHSDYITDCLKGETHIFSVADAQDCSISTFEVQLKDGKAQDRDDIPLPDESNHLQVVQHRAKSNAEPPAAAKQALAQWKKMVEQGKIAINTTQLGETHASRLLNTTSGSELERAAGFTFTEQNLENMFRYFRGDEKNKGLRGVTYNAETKTFEDDRRSYLISGHADEVNEQGKKTGKTVKRGDLTIDQWLQAKGAKQELIALLAEHAAYYGFPEKSAAESKARLL